jgi:DNA-directed RNA polymerase II subunit RPB2
LTACLAAYTGYNQEDCVIVNKSAVDRGLFVSYAYRSVTVDEKKDANVSIQPVNERMRKFNYNYHKLDPATGIVRKGLYVESNDVLVSRVMKKKTQRGFVVIDYSVVVQAREEGVIDNVKVIHQPDGTRVVRVRIRTKKTLEIGDKLANVAAQKATCGLLLNAHDMPFTAQGIVPDIIINPHALPSRMTVSMLLEMILGKTCAIRQESGDATPFTDSSTNVADKLCAALEAEGFDGSGLEDLYNGFTGEKMQSRIFIGLSYYHKLKHLVSEKVYARGYGGLQLLSAQPSVGRSKHGAMRIGEMEKDAAISQGCAALLVDRLYEASDKYCVMVCTKCHALDTCTCTGAEAKKKRVRVPHAFKLFKQQLQALCIDAEFVPPA